MGQPLDDVLSIAERAYVRMQAGELIAQCLELGDSAPFDELLQQLVLGGVPSLAILREILDEIRTTRSGLQQAGLAVRQDLQTALSGFGLHLPHLLSTDLPEVFRIISSHFLRNQVRAAAHGLKGEDQMLLDEVCKEAGDRVASIASRLATLGRLDRSARDWMECLAYEAVRSGVEVVRGATPLRQ